MEKPDNVQRNTSACGSRLLHSTVNVINNERCQNVAFSFLKNSHTHYSFLLVKVPPPSDLRVTNFSDSDITVRWEAADDDDVSYLTKWRRPETGGEELLDCWSTYYEVKNTMSQ